MQQTIIIEPEPAGRLRDMQLHIVGCRHYITDDAERQKFLADAPKLSMFMACEPTNPFDPQAIAVWVNSEPIATRVAYISTENLAKAHGLLHCYHTNWMPIRALGLQPGRHTTLLAYPLDTDGEMITDLEEMETSDTAGADPLDDGIREAAKYIDSHKADIRWSDVYYFLMGKGIVSEGTSASAFGNFIASHGGPSAQKVRKSGPYQLSTNELRRRKPVISSLSSIFRGI